LNPAQQAALKEAVQHPPREVGIDLAGWHWKVVRRFVAERFGITLSRSSCLNYLHRLGFVLKRPTKRLLKADEAKRTAFVTA
jgi:transposase